jgi:hypothetical protein
MTARREMNRTTVAAESAVLMARIVDAAGRTIERADIASIRCSIFTIDPSSAKSPAIVPGYDRLPLEVDEVTFDALELDAHWNIDSFGYNFRHEFVLMPAAQFSRASAHYQAVYEFVSSTGEDVILRFNLKMD